MDPEGRYFTPANVPQIGWRSLDEIRAVLRAQGVTAADPAEVDALVRIRTWSESCHEFAHFTDDELADGIMAVHTTIDGWSRDELVAAQAYWRASGEDIKRVWRIGRWDGRQQRMTGRWEYAVSKTKLAQALWPTLRAKIDHCRADADQAGRGRLGGGALCAVGYGPGSQVRTRGSGAGCLMYARACRRESCRWFPVLASEKDV